MQAAGSFHANTQLGLMAPLIGVRKWMRVRQIRDKGAEDLMKRRFGADQDDGSLRVVLWGLAHQDSLTSCS